MATTNCVATFGLVGPRAGISIGICVPETFTEPIPVVRNRANSTTITMTITLRRCRSSSMCSKNVIRRSLGRSSFEATFATAVIAAKRARLMYFPHKQRTRGASERVAVLGQRIRRVTVPADLPIPELFFVRERHRSHPLRALVRVALRHEEPHGSPVFDRERFPVPLIREEDVGVVQDIQRMRSRIAVPASKGRKASRGANLRAFRNFLDGDADPFVVERGPARDTMERRHHLGRRQPQELFVGETHGVLDGDVHTKVPFLRVEPRNNAEIEPRPFPNLPLSGRETPLRDHQQVRPLKCLDINRCAPGSDVLEAIGESELPRNPTRYSLLYTAAGRLSSFTRPTST